MSEYAFCEPVTATTISREHIRLIPEGELPRYGGGITGTALCGYDVSPGWDVPTGVTEQRVRRGVMAEVNPTCVQCAQIWLTMEATP